MASIEACNLAAGDEFRPLANFAPSIWGDLFSSLPIHDQEHNACMDMEIQRLKEKVRAILVDISVDTSKKVDTIGCLDRLGLSYHFEAEIKCQLETLFGNLYCEEDDKEYDLYTVSTQFLVFRQHGYKMSCDVFNKFKDPSGMFMDTLATDARGLLSLYEASHLRVRGEDILEEALAFTITNLKRMELGAQISPFLAKQVARALKDPFHFRIPRVEARAYISTYEEDHESRNRSILKLAKLDFNMQQQMHQEELCLVLKWWNDSGFREKLPYTRESVVESYFYAHTACPEPHFSLARIILAKITVFTMIVDDTYDAYSTFEESQCFTDAINRWDTNASDQLPDNMKFLYNKLLTALHKELPEETSQDAQLYGVPDSIERMKEVCRAYYQQAKWLNDGYIPQFDHEYMEVASVAILLHLLVTLSCMGMSDIATKEAFEWLRGKPKIWKVASAICRLQNDVAGHEYQQKRGRHPVSAVDCYMNQYNVPLEDAVRGIRQRIADGWKELNEECLGPTAVPHPFREWFTNSVRFTDTIYKHDIDGFTHVEIIKDATRSVFVDPVPM